jgi:Gram-negative bacterial TonB protein C-terminal
MRTFKMPVLVTCCLVVSSRAAQKDAPVLPTVTAFDCPKYPPKAESMRLQGMVKMQVTTDGHQITDVKLLPSHPVLAEEAVKNVRTWKFVDHQPTSFIVTYFYVNEGHYKKDPVTKCSAKMELPAKVTVSTSF